MILRHTLLGFAGLLGLGVACTTPATDTSSASCDSLTVCCGSAGASEQACLDIAGAGIGADCSAELSTLEAQGSCVGSGSGASTGTACVGLATCCGAMSGAAEQQCLAIVEQGVATTCSELLATYTETDACGAGSGTGTGGTGTGKGTGTGTGTGTVTVTVVTSSGGVDAGDDSGGEDAGVDATVASGSGAPPQPAGTKTGESTAHNFAIHHLYLGDDDPTPAFTPDPNAWKSLGYDLDALATTAASTNVCTPYSPGTTTQQIDGDNGIDNAFGAAVMPQLSAVGGNFSQMISSGIAAGNFTIQIDTSGLTASATQTNTGLGGQLFSGGSYGGTPPVSGDSFSSSTVWPVTLGSLNGASVSSGAKVTFPGAYVTNGTWVSGSPVTSSLPVYLFGTQVPLPVHHAIITFNHTVDASGQGHATQGIIAGVLLTSEVVTAFNQALGQVSSGSECGLASEIDSIFENAQDIVLDPSSGALSNTAGTPCNAISIGIGFDADEIQAPSSVTGNPDAGSLPACAP